MIDARIENGQVDLYDASSGMYKRTIRPGGAPASVRADRDEIAIKLQSGRFGAERRRVCSCVFESTSPPLGERHEGQDAVRAAWEGFFGSTPTAHFDAEDVIATGDRCVVQWRFTWKNDDATEGAVRGVDVIRVRDGKIAEKFAYVKG